MNKLKDLEFVNYINKNKLFNRIFRLFTLLLLSFATACGGDSAVTTPEPTEIRITQISLSYGSNNLDAISINESGKGTVSVTGVIPAKVTLKNIKLSDNNEVVKNEELTLSNNKITFTHEKKSYEVDFTTTGTGVTGTDAEIQSMKVTIGSGKPINVFFNAQKQAKVSIKESILPKEVAITTFVLSGNATSNHKLNDNLSVTSTKLSFPITVTSGDASVNNTFTIDFSLQTSTSKNILVFAFLPADGNEDADESNTSKKGINTKYFGAITEGEEVKIDVAVPTSTKSKLSPSIVHTGVSISPQNEAATAYASGFPTTYTVTDASGGTKAYKIYVHRTLLDAEIKIKSADIGTTSLSINALESQEVTGVDVNAVFKFTFSHDIDPTTINPTVNMIKIRRIELIEVSPTNPSQEVEFKNLDGDNKKIEIKPSFLLKSSTSYKLVLKNTLTSVIDGATYPLEKTYTIRFSTK